jgi:hypothetical protein
MRQAGRARTFIARADAIENVERHTRNRMVFMNQNFHAIFEQVCFNFDALRVRDEWREQEEKQDKFFHNRRGVESIVTEPK